MSGPGAASIERLIIEVDRAINARALYTPVHPSVVSSVEKLVAAVEAACVERGQGGVALLAVGDDLVVDQRPLPRGSLHHEQLVRLLNRCGVESLTLARGLAVDEALVLVSALATGGAPHTSPHVAVGHVEVRVAEDGSGARAAELVSPDRLGEAREAFTAFRGDTRRGLEPLSGIVWGLIDGLAHASRELLPLAPLKNYDEYTFVHSVNVSLLTLAQARALGIADEPLHDVGLAALLHDFGKLKVPLEVLNKPGKLEGAEWELMMGHAELGARELSRLDGIRPLSIVVAYEHHMRFDGEPSYPLPRSPRRPGLASQLTSISDVYDAICTTRPYSKARPRTVALEVLRQRSGAFHDPLLVDNFARIVLAVDTGPAPTGKQASA